MTIGTVGTRLLTGWAWIDSFYFMSMVATAQGPAERSSKFLVEDLHFDNGFRVNRNTCDRSGYNFRSFMGYLFHKGVIFAEDQEKKSKEKVKEPEL